MFTKLSLDKQLVIVVSMPDSDKLDDDIMAEVTFVPGDDNDNDRRVVFLSPARLTFDLVEGGDRGIYKLV